MWGHHIRRFCWWNLRARVRNIIWTWYRAGIFIYVSRLSLRLFDINWRWIYSTSMCCAFWSNTLFCPYLLIMNWFVIRWYSVDIAVGGFWVRSHPCNGFGFIKSIGTIISKWVFKIRYIASFCVTVRAHDNGNILRHRNEYTSPRWNISDSVLKFRYVASHFGMWFKRNRIPANLCGLWYIKIRDWRLWAVVGQAPCTLSHRIFRRTDGSHIAMTANTTILVSVFCIRFPTKNLPVIINRLIWTVWTFNRTFSVPAFFWMCNSTDKIFPFWLLKSRYFVSFPFLLYLDTVVRAVLTDDSCFVEILVPLIIIRMERFRTRFICTLSNRHTFCISIACYLCRGFENTLTFVRGAWTNSIAFSVLGDIHRGLRNYQMPSIFYLYIRDHILANSRRTSWIRRRALYRNFSIWMYCYDQRNNFNHWVHGR